MLRIPSCFKFTLSFLLILATVPSIAQKRKEFAWRPPTPNSFVDPADHPGADAVIVLQYRSISNGDLDHIQTLIQRVKLLTQGGVDMFSELVITKSEKENLLTLDVRNNKADGNVVDHSAADIVKISMENSANGWRSQRVKYRVNGLEIGDEVEIVQRISRREIIVSEEIFFDAALPVLRSVVVLEMDRHIMTSIKGYNGTGQPQQSENGSSFITKFEVLDLPPWTDDSNTIRVLTSPYVVYQVLEFITPKERIPVLKGDRQMLLGSLFTEYFTDEVDAEIRKRVMELTSSVSDRDAKIEIALRHVLEEFEIQDLEPKESSKPLKYHFSRRVADLPNLDRSLWCVLKILNAEPAIGFGRHRFLGPMPKDGSFAALATHRFLTWRDQKNMRQILILGNEIDRYEINEIPWELQGTMVISVRPSHLAHGVVAFEEFSLSSSKPDQNRKDLKTTYNVHLAEGISEGAHSLSFSGCYSSATRGKLLRKGADERHGMALPGALPGSVQASRLLFGALDQVVELEYTTVHDEMVMRSENGTVTIALKDAFLHQFPALDQEVRKNPYEVKFPFSDNFAIVFELDADVELQHPAEPFLRSFGSAEVRYAVEQTSPRSITVLLYSTMAGSNFSASQYQDLARIYSEFSDQLTQGIILKML